MKRFLVFAGDTYYPMGGWSDFKGSFDSIDAAKDMLLSDAAQRRGFDWVEIVDTDTEEIVWHAGSN